MPNLFFEHAWPGMAVWGLLFISDYTFTIVCARLYRRQSTIVFEGSYEITPFYQRDIDALRAVSPRFIFTFLLVLGAVGFIWVLNEGSPIPELWQFILGALIGPQLFVHLRHIRNFVLFRSINRAEAVRGHIEYGRRVMLRASSSECFAFSGFFLILFAFTQSWFILGGAVACFSLGAKHRRLAGRLHRNLAETAQPSEQS